MLRTVDWNTVEAAAIRSGSWQRTQWVCTFIQRSDIIAVHDVDLIKLCNKH